MIHINLNTSVYRPIKQVFRFVATPENDFQWQYGTLASTQISNGELGIGTLFRAVGHFMGQRMENIFEITEFEPNKRYGFKSLSGPIVSQTSYAFETNEGKTQITISTEINLGDFTQQNSTNLEKKLKKTYKENLSLLKSILETSPVEQLLP